MNLDSIDKNKKSVFMALLSRMDGIQRWNKSRPTRPENLNDHSLHVGLFCFLIGLKRKKLEKAPYIDPHELAVYGMLHDAPEVLSEDVNGIFKHRDPEIREYCKEIERRSANIILKSLPDELIEDFLPLLRQDLADKEIKELVKASDLIHAYTKAVSEMRVGNTDLKVAVKKIDSQLVPFREKYEEVDYVYKHFTGLFSLTIDEVMDLLPQSGELNTEENK